MADSRISVSVEEICKSLEGLSRGTRFLLTVEEKGQVPDFSVENNFFERIYPSLKQLYYTTRAQGIQGHYISGED